MTNDVFFGGNGDQLLQIQAQDRRIRHEHDPKPVQIVDLSTPESVDAVVKRVLDAKQRPISLDDLT